MNSKSNQRFPLRKEVNSGLVGYVPSQTVHYNNQIVKQIGNLPEISDVIDYNSNYINANAEEIENLLKEIMMLVSSDEGKEQLVTQFNNILPIVLTYVNKQLPSTNIDLNNIKKTFQTNIEELSKVNVNNKDVIELMKKSLESIAPPESIASPELLNLRQARERLEKSTTKLNEFNKKPDYKHNTYPLFSIPEAKGGSAGSVMFGLGCLVGGIVFLATLPASGIIVGSIVGGIFLVLLGLSMLTMLNGGPGEGGKKRRSSKSKKRTRKNKRHNKSKKRN
jgi:hypothetical protein